MALFGLSASPPMASSTELVARTVLSSYGKHAANPMGCGGELDTLIIVTVYRKNHGRTLYSFSFSFAVLALFIIGGRFYWVYALSSYLAVIHWLQAASRSLYAGFAAYTRLFLPPTRR